MTNPNFNNTFLTCCYGSFDGILSDALAMAVRQGKLYCEWNNRIYSVRFGRDTGFIIEKTEDNILLKREEKF